MLISTRFHYFLGLVIICLLLGFSFYLQAHGMVPCALCLLQRIVLAILGFIFLIGALSKFKCIGQSILAIVTLIIAAIGVFLSGRQAWLQHFPSHQTGECAASLQYMMQALPLNEVLVKVLQGSAECADRVWSLLGLSLAEWSLACFVVIFLFGFYQLYRAFKI